MADQTPKYQQVAHSLLDAPDPVYAVAHYAAEIGEQMNAVGRKLRTLEQRLQTEADLRKRGE